MKIILFGKNGQLAQQIINDFQNNFNLIVFGSDQINFQDNIKLKDIIITQKPDFVINTAAFTNVDLAESQADYALKINGAAVLTIAIACKEINATLIHFSTDYVFDGKQSIPYKETDNTNPLNIYGYSKLKGELNIIKSGCNYLIFRVAWLVSTYNKNFIKTIVTKLKNGDKLKIVNDQIGTPTDTRLIVKIIKKILISKSLPSKQIFHLTSKGAISWYGIAKYISEKCKKQNVIIHKSQIKSIKTKEYKSIALRPKYSILSHEKIEKTFNIRIPQWKKSIDYIIDFYIKTI